MIKISSIFYFSLLCMNSSLCINPFSGSGDSNFSDSGTIIKTGLALTTVAIAAYKYYQRRITQKFITAAKDGNADKLRTLVDKYPRHDLNDSNRELIGTLDTGRLWYGYPLIGIREHKPLTVAIESNNADAVEVLLEKGACITSEDIRAIRMPNQKDDSVFEKVTDYLSTRGEINSSGILQLTLRRKGPMCFYLKKLLNKGAKTTTKATFYTLSPPGFYQVPIKQELSALEAFWCNDYSLGSAIFLEGDALTNTYLVDRSVEDCGRFKLLLRQPESEIFFNKQRNDDYSSSNSSNDVWRPYWNLKHYRKCYNFAQQFYREESEAK